MTKKHQRSKERGIRAQARLLPRAQRIQSILRPDADCPHDCSAGPTRKPPEKSIPSWTWQSWQSRTSAPRSLPKSSYHPCLHHEHPTGQSANPIRYFLVDPRLFGVRIPASKTCEEIVQLLRSPCCRGPKKREFPALTLFHSSELFQDKTI